MSKRFITLSAEGEVQVTQVLLDDVDGFVLSKALFELSRTTDKLTHYDPTIHTREAIAAGLPGHRALTLSGVCDEADLPNPYFRNAWEWID